eukprot:TRINITY_DN2632_c0_g1_i3.p2 TRINITY_DN2632_c0_g1~~TRINITY_DN2632_c0_g1_i3.p2  ORF type:complete len:110 (+),score=33.11 TRINITY_DN2632_c0_g1_i3:74-403(+)
MAGKMVAILFLFALAHVVDVNAFRKREEDQEAVTQLVAKMEAAQLADSTKKSESKSENIQQVEVSKLSHSNKGDGDDKGKKEEKSYAAARSTSLFVMSAGIACVAFDIL